MKTKKGSSVGQAPKELKPSSVGSGAMVRPPKRKTKAQRHAADFLELHSIVHYLMTEGKCPVMLGDRLAFVRCPGVSKEAFRQAIGAKVVGNLAAMLSRPNTPDQTRRDK